ncbi:transglutaminase-like domain-containing protein [Quadrisphaera setariae]|uniref:transglutaminase-like domain-containing protein n=1 Tax=Quadrisphaera setariae TaxID=2593304 RepID=UPI001C9C9E95|nr:transglutaminase-like domain-containing protein [Quadrisphaera setariae]
MTATAPTPTSSALTREVFARLELQLSSPADLSLLVAAARTPGSTVEDELVVTHADGPLPQAALPVEVAVGPRERGERMHVLTGVPAGRVVVEYAGRLTPAADAAGAPSPVDLVERFELNRPSRYCPSDELTAFAAAEFGTRAQTGDAELAERITAWVADRLVYTSGSSTPFDGAVQTLLRGQGVCRDYAHLVVTLARALELPARLTAVYAPGLSPMDFHAVAEIRVEDGAGAAQWQVHDATHLAPRPSLWRISTGRDAVDTAFLTSLRGGVALREMQVRAVVTGGDLPTDPTGPVLLR